MKIRDFARCLTVALLATCVVAANAGDKAGITLTGENLKAWRQPTGQWQIVGEATLNESEPKLLTSRPGSGILLNGLTGKTNNLLSAQEFGDVEVSVEFMVSKGSNSGIYFQGRYEIQVLDSFGVKSPKYSDCGGIYQRWKDGKGYEGIAPLVNASKAPGQWQKFEVVFHAPRFDEDGKKTANAKFVRVAHNGKLIHENVEVAGPTRAATFENDEKPTGPLMLQGDHGPVAYRNLRVRPLEK